MHFFVFHILPGKFTGGSKTQLGYFIRFFGWELISGKNKNSGSDNFTASRDVEHRRFELLTPTLPARRIAFSGFFCFCETLVKSSISAFYSCLTLYCFVRLFISPVHIRYTKTGQNELMTHNVNLPFPSLADTLAIYCSGGGLFRKLSKKNWVYAFALII